MESLLAEQGLHEKAERFSGIVASKPINGLPLSVTGCLLSHLSLWDSLRDSETTIILEDDVCLSKDFGSRIPKILSWLESTKLDLLFLGQTVLFKDAATHAQLIKILKKSRESGEHRFFDAASTYRFGAFGYAVNYKSAHKFRKLAQDLDLASSAKPIDILMKDWLKKNQLKGAVAIPYLVGADPGMQTTMSDRSNSFEHQLHCELVNLYLHGYSSNPLDYWRHVLDDNPNEDALEMCKILYTRLTQ